MSVRLDMIDRGWGDFLARPNGSLSLRFYVQPTMAGLLALWAGIQVGMNRTDAPTPHVWIVGSTQTNGPADYPCSRSGRSVFAGSRTRHDNIP